MPARTAGHQDKTVNSGFQGVGFSIPSDDVKETLHSILERGRPVRGYLGVGMGQVERGVMLLYLAPGGPAEDRQRG